MRMSDPDLLTLAETAGETISSIAAKLEKSEFWVARVLGCKTTCTPAEAGQIAEILGTDPLHTSGLTVPQDPPRSRLSVVGLQVFDRVLIGALALFVALTVEHNFRTFTLKRERALAVSNVNSQFLIDRYTQAKTDFVALLVQLESARQVIAPDTINTSQAQSAAKSLQSITNRLEVDINVIAAAHPRTKIPAAAFTKTLRLVTGNLIDLRPPPTNYDHNVSLLRTQFFDLSNASQQAMVQTVEAELLEVEDGRFLWW